MEDNVFSINTFFFTVYQVSIDETSDPVLVRGVVDYIKILTENRRSLQLTRSPFSLCIMREVEYILGSKGEKLSLMTFDQQTRVVESFITQLVGTYGGPYNISRSNTRSVITLGRHLKYLRCSRQADVAPSSLDVDDEPMFKAYLSRLLVFYRGTITISLGGENAVVIILGRNIGSVISRAQLDILQSFEGPRPMEILTCEHGDPNCCREA